MHDEFADMMEGIPDWFTIPVMLAAWLAVAAGFRWVLRELGAFGNEPPEDPAAGLKHKD
jgi:hypothetical protein